MAKIHFNRLSKFLDLTKDCIIYVDEKSIGNIEDGRQKEFQITVGSHEVYTTIANKRSNIIDFEVLDKKDIVSFEIESKFDFFNGLLSPFTFLFITIISTYHRNHRNRYKFKTPSYTVLKKIESR